MAQGTGKFMSERFVSSTKMGPDGRPIKESYQTRTNGAYAGGRKPEVLERKQMYKNTGTGLEKAAIERMYQGKGRKVVYENNNNSYNYYKNMREEQAPDFDREWQAAADKYGINSISALPYGSGAPKPYHRSSTRPSYGDGYFDEGRRGHFISDRVKGENMPVAYGNQPPTHVERLRPADTSHRLDVPNNREGDQPALALPSNDNRNQARQQVRNNYGGRVNARAPNRGRKQARIG